MTSSHLLRRAEPLLAVGLSAALFGACGDSTSSGATPAGSSSNDRDTARLKLTQCLRENEMAAAGSARPIGRSAGRRSRGPARTCSRAPSVIAARRSARNFRMPFRGSRSACARTASTCPTRLPAAGPEAVCACTSWTATTRMCRPRRRNARASFRSVAGAAAWVRNDGCATAQDRGGSDRGRGAGRSRGARVTVTRLPPTRNRSRRTPRVAIGAVPAAAAPAAQRPHAPSTPSAPTARVGAAPPAPAPAPAAQRPTSAPP